MRVRPKAALVAMSVALMLTACRQKDTPSAPKEPDQKDTPSARKEPDFIPSPNNLLRVRHMVLAVANFTLLHELGHMIVNDYSLAKIGEEEDGVDKFATLMMTPSPRPAGSPPDSFDPAVDPDSPGVMWASWWWHEVWTQKQTKGELPDYAARHGLAVQRSRRVMCLVYGSDPARFERPFKAFLSEQRRRECIEDARDNRRTWEKVLGQPELRGSSWKYEGRITYNPAVPVFAAARTLLMESKTLEQFAKDAVNELSVPFDLAPRVSPPPSLGRWGEANRLPIDIVGDSCLRDDGKADINAFWDPSRRQIVLCYGLVRLFEDYSRATIARTEIGQREKWPNPPR
jgi:hypothetical protein